MLSGWGRLANCSARIVGRRDGTVALCGWSALTDRSLIAYGSWVMLAILGTEDETDDTHLSLLGIVAVVAKIEERTDGWIAVIRLTTLILGDRANPAALVGSFAARAGRPIMDFLDDEVLIARSDDVQRFLLRTAVPERLSAGLCDALIAGTPDGGRARLHWSASNGRGSSWTASAVTVFGPATASTSVPCSSVSWRNGRGIDEVRALHAHAGAWFAEAGMIEDAVRVSGRTAQVTSLCTYGWFTQARNAAKRETDGDGRSPRPRGRLEGTCMTIRGPAVSTASKRAKAVSMRPRHSCSRSTRVSTSAWRRAPRFRPSTVQRVTRSAAR